MAAQRTPNGSTMLNSCGSSQAGAKFLTYFIFQLGKNPNPIFVCKPEFPVLSVILITGYLSFWQKILPI